MNKILLLEEIHRVLQTTYENAAEAAMRAYDTATNDENVAENKYDTLALEASYLAHGQAQRVAECEADIVAFNELSILDNTAKSTISLGSLVKLINDKDKYRYLFLGPSAGGLKLMFEQKEVIIITPSSPLGSRLMHREPDEEISVQIADQVVNYEIVMIY